MPTTDPVFGWPLPVAADPPDLPTQLAALADAIAAQMRAKTFVQYGTAAVGPFEPGGTNPSRSIGNEIPFPIPYLARPVVAVGISAVYRWCCLSVVNLTEARFDAYDTRSSIDGATDTADWWAVGPIDPADLP